MRTTLQSGAWVEHRPIGDLKGADKRTLDRLVKPEVVFRDDGEPDLPAMLSGIDMLGFMADKQDALWALLITAWSYELPVPRIEDYEVKDAEAFGQLPLDDFDEIEALFAPYEAKLTRRPDPKASTTSASNGSSRAAGARGSRTG